MKSLAISAAALWVLLTPALAQQAEPPIADQAQQASSTETQQRSDQQGSDQQLSDQRQQPAAEDEASPADGPSGMTQAAAQLAAQAETQSAEEQNSTASPTAEPVPSGQPPQPSPLDQMEPNGASQSGEPSPIAPPPNAQPADDSSDETMPPDAPPLEATQPDPTLRPDPAQPQPSPQSTRQRREPQPLPAIRPRAEAAAYPVFRQQPQLSIGAKLLSAKEVEQKFSTPLGKHYLVVEVGVFPAVAQTIRLRPEDFTLRVGTEDQAFFPATPEDIASALSGSGRRTPRIFPTLGVGYGGGGWDRGVSTGVGVGVGGGPYPRRGGMAGSNQRVIENELRDKSLPEGSLTQPAAGYLYFPLSGKRSAHYNLELSRNGEILSLALPAPEK